MTYPSNKYKYGDMVDVNTPWNYGEYGSRIVEKRYMEGVNVLVNRHIAGTYSGWAYKTDETVQAKPGAWIQEQHIYPHSAKSMDFESMMDKLRTEPA